MHRDSVITACNISQSLELKSHGARMHRETQSLREMMARKTGRRDRKEKERDEQRDMRA